MIENMVLETIEAARKNKAEMVKQASEKSESEEMEKSPIAFNLRKLAESILRDGEPASTTTKVAGDSEQALKGLTLLKKYTGGIYAS